jgi:hypothetical protein
MTFPSFKTIGIVWYLREDYPRIVEIMEDGEQLPSSFDEWLALAEKLETEFLDCGLFVVRVTIEPETFLVWQTAHGLPADAAMRDLFASEYAFWQTHQTPEGADDVGHLVRLTSSGLGFMEEEVDVSRRNSGPVGQGQFR